MFNLIINFFYNWYIEDTKIFYNRFIGFLKFFDRDIGLAGNLRNWLNPLYGDYSTAGRAIGPILRTFRIFFGIIFYLLITILSLAVYLIWIILPILAIIMAVLNLLVLIKAPEPVFALGEKALKLFIQ